jgi:hypothetical protein
MPRLFSLRLLALAGCIAASVMSAAVALTAEFSVQQQEDRVIVSIDGQLFTEYLLKNGPKPTLWPIIGPTGVPMTRAYPMKDVPGEKHDHPHHRSLWFTHGKVNGTDFWSELKGHGSIQHRAFEKVAADGNKATIVTVNDWIDPEGKKQCEDRRTVTFSTATFSTAGDARVIDYDIVVKAVPGRVTFGDTKEGSFGIRVPTVMDVESKQGGRIVNSEGATDKDAWGKPATWVDYHGPVEGETVGIAILNHPSSFRAPTTWHVRTYGLFAANPFGLHDFDKASADGSYTLEAGQTMSLRYRVIFHRGDEKQAGIQTAYEKYAAEK